MGMLGIGLKPIVRKWVLHPPPPLYLTNNFATFKLNEKQNLNRARLIRALRDVLCFFFPGL